MKWRKDGPDYLTGSKAKGRCGGMVLCSWNGSRAYAWTRDDSLDPSPPYASPATAMHAVEKWLKRRGAK